MLHAKIKELNATISTLEKQRSDLQKEIIQKHEAFIQEHHPLKIGDIVTVSEFGYKGKQMQIYDRDLRCVFDTYYWTAKGYVLNKTGQPGKNTGFWEQRITNK